jgi:hypothetical protein
MASLREAMPAKDGNPRKDVLELMAELVIGKKLTSSDCPIKERLKRPPLPAW